MRHGVPFILDQWGNLITGRPGSAAGAFSAEGRDDAGRIVQQLLAATPAGEGAPHLLTGSTASEGRATLYEHFPELGWIVGTTVDLGYIYAPLKSFHRIALLASLGIVATILFLSHWLSRSSHPAHRRFD